MHFQHLFGCIFVGENRRQGRGESRHWAFQMVPLKPFVISWFVAQMIRCGNRMSKPKPKRLWPPPFFYACANE